MILCVAVDQACAQENALHATEIAQEHGLTGGPLPKQAPSWEEVYRYTDPEGSTVELKYRMHDQTKTFGPIEKDMNRLTLSLSGPHVIAREHCGHYED